MAYCPACEKTSDDGSRFCPFCGAQMAVVQAAGDDPYLGKLVAGKYLVEELLGEGGMGRVYKALQQPLDKAVVLKVLRAALQGDASLVARFQREARAASRLSHSNSIQVTDFGQMEDGALFIAMEFLQGRDLAEEMALVGPFPEERLVNVMSQVLSALAEAHEAGVIHRDMKPENVMLVPRRDDPDHVKVLDFGIAKLQEANDGPDAVALTQAGLVCGTPAYMSPEQASGKALDARSDLYAIGVMMYQLASGQLPFQADSSIGLVTKHLIEEPVPPRQVRPSISVELEALILRCLAKKPEERPANAEALRTELRAVLRAQEQGTMPSIAAVPPPAAVATPAPASAAEPIHTPSPMATPPQAAAPSAPPPPFPSRPEIEGDWSTGETYDDPDADLHAPPKKGGGLKAAVIALAVLVPVGAAAAFLVFSGVLSKGGDDAGGEVALVTGGETDSPVAGEADGPGGDEQQPPTDSADQTGGEQTGGEQVSGRRGEDGVDEPAQVEQPEQPAPTKVAQTKQAPATKQSDRQATAGAGTKARETGTQRRGTTTEPATKATTGGRAGATQRAGAGGEAAGGRTGGRAGVTDGGRSGMARDPARARILATTAERHWAQGDFERALSLYEQAANHDPTEPTYQRQIGLANLSLGREARAVSPLRRYLQMSPDAADRQMIESLIRQHGR